MKAQGTFLVPTLLAPVSVIEFADELGMSEGSVEKSKEVLEAHTTSFTKAVNAGVKSPWVQMLVSLNTVLTYVN